MNTLCSVCANPKTKLKEKRIKLYHCPSCNHTFTEAQEDPSLYHNEYYTKEREHWFHHPDYGLFNSLYQKLTSRLSSPIKIIDIGCGTGAFLKHLYKKDNSLELTGIDLSQNTHPDITFVQGDFRNTSLADTYDAICSFMAIEHIRDVNDFVRKVSNISHSNTFLCINTINNNSLVYKIGRFLNKLGFHGPHDRLYSRHHLNHFTNESLRQLLEQNGWHVVEQWNHNYPLAAVDVLNPNKASELFYKTTVAIMFFVSDILGNQQAQTIICKKLSKAKLVNEGRMKLKFYERLQ